MFRNSVSSFYVTISVHSPMKGATPVPVPIRITGTEVSFGRLNPILFLGYKGTWKQIMLINYS